MSIPKSIDPAQKLGISIGNRKDYSMRNSFLCLLPLVVAASFFPARFARADTIYVATALDDAIHQFTTNGVESDFARGTIFNPYGMAFDKAGNLYVANAGENVIEKFGPDGTASIFASDPGDNSVLASPAGLAFDSDGNLYVANTGNNTIEKITTNGVASVFVSDPGFGDELNGPEGMAFDTNGNLYVANDGDFIEEFAPNGTPSGFGDSSFLNSPVGLAFDTNGNLYVANSLGADFGPTIAEFDTAGNGSVFAGDGLDYPEYIAFDAAGNLLVANSGTSSNNLVKIAPDGTPSVFSGSGVAAPFGVAFDSSGNLFVSNAGQFIQKYDTNGLDSRFASASISGPQALALDSAGNLYLANINPQLGTIEKFDTNAVPSVFASYVYAYGLAVDAADDVYAAGYYFNVITKFTPNGSGSTFASTGLSNPEGMVFDTSGNLYVVNGSGDSSQNGNVIEKFDAGGNGMIFATNRTGLNSAFGPGLAIDSANNIYVPASVFSTNIVKYSPGGVPSDFAMDNASSFILSNAQGMDFDSAGNLYVANYYDGTVMKYQIPPAMVRFLPAA